MLPIGSYNPAANINAKKSAVWRKPLLAVHLVLVVPVWGMKRLDLNIRPPVRQRERIYSVLLNIPSEREPPCVFSSPIQAYHERRTSVVVP